MSRYRLEMTRYRKEVTEVVVEAESAAEARALSDKVAVSNRVEWKLEPNLPENLEEGDVIAVLVDDEDESPTFDPDLGVWGESNPSTPRKNEEVNLPSLTPRRGHRVMVTFGADTTFNSMELDEALRRHFANDWGDLGDEDAESNRRAVFEGVVNKVSFPQRVMSTFMINKARLWVITDAGWQTTTLLLPEEY